MSLTARKLNRATLGRQLLLRREPLGVVAAASIAMRTDGQRRTRTSTTTSSITDTAGGLSR
jgi:hypothetical protein